MAEIDVSAYMRHFFLGRPTTFSGRAGIGKCPEQVPLSAIFYFSIMFLAGLA